MGEHNALSFSLKMNELKVPDCNYFHIPRSEIISRCQKTGGGLEARKIKKQKRIWVIVNGI